MSGLMGSMASGMAMGTGIYFLKNLWLYLKRILLIKFHKYII